MHAAAASVEPGCGDHISLLGCLLLLFGSLPHIQLKIKKKANVIISSWVCSLIS